MLDGHSRPSVHTVGGVLLGVSLDNKRSEVDGQFQFPKVYERYFRLIRSDYDSEHIKSSELLDRLDGYDVLVALLGPTPTWRGRGYQMMLTLPQFLPLRARVGLRPNNRCCPCFKCWLQVHSVKLRPDCSPRCQAQTVQSQCTKLKLLDMKVRSVCNQLNFGLSCYLEWLDLEDETLSDTL